MGLPARISFLLIAILLLPGRANSVLLTNQRRGSTAGNQGLATVWRIYQSGAFTLAQKIALIEHLQSRTVLARLDSKDLIRYQVTLARDYISTLWEAGLIDDGLAALQQLPDDVRKGVLAAAATESAKQRVTLDGSEISIGEMRRGDLRLEQAAALLAADRRQEAERIFQAWRTAPEGMKTLECAKLDLVKQGERDCYPERDRQTIGALLESSLNQPTIDPYDLVERIFGDPFSSFPTHSALWCDLLKRRLDEPEYRTLGHRTAADWQLNSRLKHRAAPRADLAALERVIGPAFQRRTDAVQTQIDAVVRRLGGELSAPDFKIARRNLQRAPILFKPKKLPASLRTPRRQVQDQEPEQTVATPGMAPLPEGFWPVRVESAQNRAVAISVSQNLDPTGEVSHGGYWVHLSDDGGRTWNKPLYTGLAERYPYVVMPSSRMPLWHGNTLQIEVEIRELDLSSVTYPPVSLRSRRQERDLYLEIPLALLSKDSDGDSIPDIEEEHLLLDPNNPDTDGDGIIDGRDAMPNVPFSSTPGPFDKPLSAVLGGIFKASFGALIMGTDVPPSSKVRDMLERQPGEPVSRDRPIFLEGDPQDFGGFRPDRMMLVYTAAQLDRLSRVTPDFRAVELQPVVTNRAHDKGFVVWSGGWTGGTYRLTRTNDEWTVESIGSWIS